MPKFLWGTAAALCLLSAGSASAAELIVEDGQLTGANGITFDDRIFDVQFVDGTCGELYNGCDSKDDFIFSDMETARLFSFAILSQVLIGEFDDDPSLTQGCEFTLCNTFLPYYSQVIADTFPPGSVAVVGPVNYDANNDFLDNSLSQAISSDFDSTSNGFFNFVVVTEQSSVPEPASWAMMLLGFFGIGGVMRRRRGSQLNAAFS